MRGKTKCEFWGGYHAQMMPIRVRRRSVRACRRADRGYSTVEAADRAQAASLAAHPHRPRIGTGKEQGHAV